MLQTAMRIICLFIFVLYLTNCVNAITLSSVSHETVGGVAVDRVSWIDKKGNKVKSVSYYKDKNGNPVLHGDSLHWEPMIYSFKRQGFCDKYRHGKLIESSVVVKYLERGD